MTEKSYGGEDGVTRAPLTTLKNNMNNNQFIEQQNKLNKANKTKTNMKATDVSDIKKAGQISIQVKQYIKTIVKKDMLMLHLAEQIESKILELGGQIAFPVNLSINEIAAHHTPSYNDTDLTHGLLKVDFGVCINGFTADSAISFDLDDSEENKHLIRTAEEALKKSTELVIKNKSKTKINEIGREIEHSINSNKLQPIINLSGHSIEKYDLHAGTTIPNVDNLNTEEINTGIFAIEPFVTTSSGIGKVYDSKPGEIYHLISRKPIRDPTARQILDYIEKEYKTLPFCTRWVVKKFGTKALIALKQLTTVGALHNYEELVEQSKNKVAQAEHTLIIDNEVTIIN